MYNITLITRIYANIQHASSNINIQHFSLCINVELKSMCIDADILQRRPLQAFNCSEIQYVSV